MSDRGSEPVRNPKFIDFKDFKSVREKVQHELRAPEGKRFFRSLDELSNTTDFREMMNREFPLAASEWDDGVSRRNFIKLMGASLALAGVTGCLPKPEEKIVPYVQQPEILTPGKPLFYATSLPWGGFAKGVLVEQHEGRPTKIEGNKDHPASLGAADVWGQASILSMYDPDRSPIVTRWGNISSWGSFVSTLSDAIAFEDWADKKLKRRTKPAKIHILTETTTSPTIKAQMEALKQAAPDTVWHTFDAVGRDNTRQGAKDAFGEDVSPVYRFDKAKTVVTLDSNFLTEDPGSLRYARDYISLRKVRVDGRHVPANRLYAIESVPTVVGAMADYRLRTRPEQVHAFAVALYKAVSEGKAEGATFGEAKWFGDLVKELLANKGSSIVVAGEYATPEVHTLAHAINAALENISAGKDEKPVVLIPTPEANPVNSAKSITELRDAMKAGQVDVLLLLGGNPAYNAPADLDFAKLLAEVSPAKGNSAYFVAHLGLYEDETARICEWHIPEAFFLEAWGDLLAYDGTASIVQPLIAPLYPACKSATEVIAAVLDKAINTPGVTPAAKPTSPVVSAGSAYDAVRATWSTWKAANGGGDFEAYWHESLHNGFLAGTTPAAKPLPFKGDIAKASTIAPAPSSGLTLMLRPDPHVWDGGMANNAWLQELPKPLTKLTWDNALLISPRVAKALFGVSDEGNVFKENYSQAQEKTVDIKVGDRELKGVPVWVIPGHPDMSATLHLGYGRKWAGRVASPVDGQVGFDAYSLRTTSARWNLQGAVVTPAGGTYPLARTQNHQVINKTLNDDRELVIARSSLDAAAIEYAHERAEKDGTGEEFDPHEEKYTYNYEKNLTLARKVGLPILPDDPSNSPASLFPVGPDQNEIRDNSYPAWGMVIDQTACIGCNACVVACQSENNIPVVGKEQVRNERQMHWLRIDTYYLGTPIDGDTVGITDPEATYFQPVPCMQCEKAPCEVVCPVGATVHSKEGLNDMAYNRCVGTRYCSNNCPYKVRRFNFLKYVDDTTPVLKLSRNPEVTVRSRGVMEKCTYCTQRISRGRIESKKVVGSISSAPESQRPDLEAKARSIINSITPACAQSCPTQAITFGNMADPETEVAKLKREPVGFHYALLAELNTRPRTTYLARIDNPIGKEKAGEKHEDKKEAGAAKHE